jgi:hypothetical protein
MGGMILTGKTEVEFSETKQSQCFFVFSQGLAWESTWATVVRDRQPIAYAVARPV